MKVLTEVDSIYKNAISGLSVKERVAYCENLIDKAQLNLVRNKKFLDAKLTEHLLEIIAAAQCELKILKEVY